MVQLYGRAWSRSDLLERVGHPEQLAGLEPLVAADGRERGNRSFLAWNGGGLCFQVQADRCLDIGACRYRGVSVAWASPAGEVHPSFYEPEGLGWLRSFPGGLFVTCGLDQFGAPSEDQGERLGLHGRVGNLPARAVAHSAHWEGDEYLLEVSGEVRQARVFGENLVLRRRIRTGLGWNRLEVEDTVTNEGFKTTPHMILYHFNLGFPLVSPEARLALASEKVIARDEAAEAGLGEWNRFSPPIPGFREQVFRHLPRADAEGRVQLAVENPGLGLSLRLSYLKAELPHLFQWKMMGQGAYVLGLEPANCSGIEGRAAARERGDLPTLEPGASRTYHLRVELEGNRV